METEEATAFEDVEIIDESPLSFAEASEKLRDAKDREELAHLVLRYARSMFVRAALFTVHPRHIVGWQGIGEGLAMDNVRSLSFPRNVRTVLSMVAESRSYYLGPLQKWAAHGPWVKATGRQIPLSIVVAPVLLRGRVINLFYGDNGHDAHADSNVGELLILAQRIAESYEALLKPSRR